MRNQVYCINFCLIIFIKHCLEHLYVHMCVLFHRESTEVSITTTQYFYPSTFYFIQNTL